MHAACWTMGHTPARVVFHSDLYPGSCKDEMPLYHDGICGVARVCAPPEGNGVITGNFLRAKGHVRLQFRDSRSSGATLQSTLTLQRPADIYTLACSNRRMAGHLEQVCHSEDCCLLVRTNFVAPYAMLFQEGCAIIGQVPSGASRLSLAQGVHPIAVICTNTLFCHCGDCAALNDAASSR